MLSWLRRAGSKVPAAEQDELDASPTSLRLPGFARAHDGGVEALNARYELTDLLGSGTYGSAHRAVCKATGADRAVKRIKVTARTNQLRLNAELSIARQLDHPNIVRLFETFREEACVAMVMELCTGGELFDKICGEGAGGFEEALAASYARQIFSALNYMHGKLIVHRDVKPENFLLSGSSREASLKLIDFGLAKQLSHAEEMLKTKVGTPYYVAPEVLHGEYDERCDVWSAGVLTYTMLVGYPPFHGRTDREVLKRVQRGEYEFRPSDWSEISLSAKALVTETLTFEMHARPAASEALMSHWLQKAPLAGEEAAGEDEDEAAAAGSCDASPGGRLGRLVRAAAAWHLGDDDLRPLQMAFRLLDQNCDGILSQEELDAAAGSERPGDGSCTARSTRIDYTEFLASTVDESLLTKPEVSMAAFRTFDLDGDGKISLEELEQVLDGGSGGPVDELLREADTNGDGCIDYQEFVAALSLRSEPCTPCVSAKTPVSRRALDAAGDAFGMGAPPDKDKHRQLSGGSAGSWSTAPSASALLGELQRTQL